MTRYDFDPDLQLEYEVRNDFLPPRTFIRRLASDDKAGWRSVPPVPLLTDMQGEQAPAWAARIRLAYDDRHLYLRATADAPDAVVKPGVPPESGEFWTQDHVELRLLPDPGDVHNQVQFIIAPDGRVSDSLGLFRQGGIIAAGGQYGPEGWSVSVRIPFDSLGLPAPKPGDAIRGIVGHTRWAKGYYEIACVSPVVLGYTHANRMAELVFDDAGADDVRLELVDVGVEPLERGYVESRLTLVNPGDGPLSGRLDLIRDKGDRRPGWSCSQPVTLAPGPNTLEVPLELDRPQYNRYGFRFRQAGLSRELAAVTLRAAPPRVDPANLDLAHPHLFFTDERLEEIRRKRDNPAFAPLLEGLELTDADLEGPDESALSLDYEADKTLISHRVAGRMVAERDRPGPLRRTWEYLPADARAEVEKAARGEEADASVVAAGLNAILRRADFYRQEDFADAVLPAKAQQMLAGDPAALDADELVWLNRHLLDAPYALHVPIRNAGLVGQIAERIIKWVIHRDGRLIEAATKYVRAASKYLVLRSQTDLHEGGMSSSLAMAYDTAAPHLNDADREVWRELLGRFLQIHLNTARAGHWNCTSIPNANPVCNGGGGLVALAMLTEHPDAPESLFLARKAIRNHVDYCNGSDGGNTEGQQYWQYGTENLLRFAVGLETALGTDDGLITSPSFRRFTNMIRVGLCNDGRMHGVNDTIPMPVGAEIAMFLAGRFQDRLALWYADHAVREYERIRAAGLPCPYRPGSIYPILYRPDVPECTDQPPLPTAFHLPDIEYSMVRSGANYDCTFTAGLKGSRPPYTHHNQPDTGSFFINLRGERLMIDPGYYKSAPADHCLPLIDGVGPVQPNAYTGRITQCAGFGDVRLLVCDATAAYRGKAKRVIRHLALVGEEAIVLLDDVVPTAGDARVTAQYQAGGVTQDRRDGRRIMVKGRSAKLRLELLTRPELSLTLHEERDLHDTHWGYHFAECRMFPLTGEYEPDETDPLVTAFVDASKGRPKVCRSRNRNGTLTVTLPSKRRVVFTYGNGQWWLDRVRTDSTPAAQE